MSRLQTQSKKAIKTMLYFTDDYKSLIKERDKSFYDNNKSELDKFSYVIQQYTGDDYWYLNAYLRDGSVMKFSEKELRSI